MKKLIAAAAVMTVLGAGSAFAGDMWKDPTGGLDYRYPSDSFAELNVPAHAAQPRVPGPDRPNMMSDMLRGGDYNGSVDSAERMSIARDMPFAVVRPGGYSDLDR